MDATGGNVTQPNEATFFHPSAKKKPAHLSRILMCLTQLKAKKYTHWNMLPKKVIEKRQKLAWEIATHFYMFDLHFFWFQTSDKICSPPITPASALPIPNMNLRYFLKLWVHLLLRDDEIDTHFPWKSQINQWYEKRLPIAAFADIKKCIKRWKLAK